MANEISNNKGNTSEYRINSMQLNPSTQFYKHCKKCKNESYDSNDIITEMDKLIKKHGIESIDINYEEFDDYPLKYIFKYCKPNILQYIIDQFKCKKNNEIDLYKIDNINLRNNVLHYMIQELCGNTEKDAIKLCSIIYDEKYEQILKPHSLLYQYNDYFDTPIGYCRKRKFLNLTKQLEKIKYVHIHEFLIKQCKIPYEISHCIIGFVFQVVEAKNLDQLRNRWDVMISPRRD
eukprot:425774_1